MLRARAFYTELLSKTGEVYVKKGEMLFVYGTLRPGERASLTSSRLSFDVELLGGDMVNGKLYHLGGYPGVKLVSAPLSVFDKNLDTVKGEAFLLKNDAIHSVLDAYESYRPDDPEGGLYNRVRLHSICGRVLWVYVYNHPVLEEQRILSGDWKNPRMAEGRSLSYRF